MAKVLIFCSNLHGGGSAAVATSFISSLTDFQLEGLEVELSVSRYVYDNLVAKNVDFSLFNNVVVNDCFGMSAIWNKGILVLDQYDVVFTVFGPLYSLRNIGKVNIVGFAQPSIVYPERIKYFERRLFRRLWLRLKYKVQEVFFCKADYIVVELDHVRKRLERKLFFINKKIEVVHSTFDDIYLDRNAWLPLGPLPGEGVKLGLISRNYPHKNLAIFPEVKRQLRDFYNLNCTIYVTLSEDEWSRCSDDFRNNVINVGTLNIAQCPAFYEEMDAIVFPTLLECFSAVPVEAMVMGKKLFASNLPFIHDCALDFAYYFDPMDCNDVARCIHVGLQTEDEEMRSSAREYALNFGGGVRRAEEYLGLIKGILHDQK